MTERWPTAPCTYCLGTGTIKKAFPVGRDPVLLRPILVNYVYPCHACNNEEYHGAAEDAPWLKE